jgi:hypothetical protein
MTRVVQLSASSGRCVVVFITLLASHLFAAESWVRLSTPNFDLYSSLNQKQATIVLKQLEDARQALAPLYAGDAAVAAPVRVIAFRSESEYSRYRSNEASAAYYLRTDGRDYIVLGQDLASGGTPVVHEYVHYLLHQRYRHLPLWLDEGLAEVYSTAIQERRGLRIGLPPDDRLDWLRMDSPAYDLPTLFTIRQSSFANVKHLTPRSRFYAESWLLVHMLRLAPEYAAQFPSFLEDIERGEHPGKALLERYGKTVAAVTEDMRRYLKAGQMPTELMHVSRKQLPAAVSASTLQSAEWQAVLSDLRSALGRPREASAAWTK